MIKKILLSAFLVVSAVQFSMGQGGVNATANDQQLVTIQIISLAELTFNSSEGNNVFQFNTLDELEEGLPDKAGVLEVRSNKNWTINAKVDFKETGLDTKDGFMFELFIDDVADSRKVLTSAPQNVASGDRGAGNVNHRVVNYHITPGLNVDPGNYDVEVQYVLTQQ
ncbi:hypothetical protein KIH41_09395 [Litoribacter ruber]|uniref:hypothetical protein n=1 Tax=Litoribacter ruber TaxID=702568 RepID=UPI001BDA309B|nr:hypothetical protein [Litoribacter ruber]MBT0811491.1 hypothetical protein [Litoribacter ruber]